MKYIDEFRDKGLVDKWAGRIRRVMPQRRINIMEVCGTHTQNFFRFGLNHILPENLRLISGPGCPVCVSHQEYIDQAIWLAGQPDIEVLTFGDMLRIPGTRLSLEIQRARFGRVRVVYSPLDALDEAKANPDKKIVFLAVGFETTAPAIALSLLAAKQRKIKNLFFLCALKLIPPAMDFLARDKEIRLDGFLCPGHVSTVIGAKAYDFIARRYKLPCCVAGFEPVDILEGLYLLLKDVQKNKSSVQNQYLRAVKREGNLKAQAILKKVFSPADADWRGLGVIPKSGLKLKRDFIQFDAERFFGLKSKVRSEKIKTRCKCGEVLKGIISPKECPLFKKACSPEKPIGPCMVSSEGACNAYFRYGR